MSDKKSNLITATPWNLKGFGVARDAALLASLTKRTFEPMLRWHAHWSRAMELPPLPAGDAHNMNDERLNTVCASIIRNKNMKDHWLKAKKVMREEQENQIWGYDEIDYSQHQDIVQVICDNLNEGRDPLDDDRIPRVTHEATPDTTTHTDTHPDTEAT